MLSSNDQLVGAIAGLSASTLWVFTTLCFTAAGRRIGATRVNTFRICVALLLHATTLYIVSGSLWPVVQRQQLVYLALSGVIGLAICDQALFSAFILMGPRRTLLIATTTPLFSLALGVAFLHERPPLLALLGIAITLCGIAWVVSQRAPATENGVAGRRAHGFTRAGVSLALLASVAQATGTLFSKLGMGHGWLDDAQHLAPQPATYIRMIFGLAGMTPIVLMQVKLRGNGRSAPQRIGTPSQGYMLAAMGALVGPYLGVWSSLIAFDKIDIGVAQTLCGLSPVLILPVAILVEHERISRQAIVGSLVAVAGSALLFLQ